MIPFMDAGAGVAELDAGIRAAVERVLGSGWYILGPEVDAFEQEWAHYCGQEHGVGVASGLDAIQLALEALGIGPGDEVIVPANTYIATWLAVTFAGATPVPVEPDPQDFTMDPDAAAAAITPRTAAILPVHLYGQPARMGELRALAAAHGLALVADGAQAHGSADRGEPVAASADATAWSFYPTKNLGALGDGGAVTTDDGAIAERVRLLRNYGSREKNKHEVVGRNSRLDELQAAILRVKLGALDEWNERRRLLAATYRAVLEPDLVAVPAERPQSRHVWHLFVVRVPHRDAVLAALREAGVQAAVHYPTPPYAQSAYRDSIAGSFPLSDSLHASVLSLPMYPQLATGTAQIVAETLNDVIRSNRWRPHAVAQGEEP